MIAPRTVWRILVLPVYLLIAGAVFALALRNTAGSILSPLAVLAPWVLVIASLMAALSIIGTLLRWRRRLAAVRRMRVDHAPACTTHWQDEDTAGVAHHAGRG